jgi:uncharacterized protein YeaO (DUF488 family)
MVVVPVLVLLVAVLVPFLHVLVAVIVVQVGRGELQWVHKVAKRDDLAFFLREICGMEYVHAPDLAPTKEMLDAFRKEHRDWATYEREFLALLGERRIEEIPTVRQALADGCLLCSEDTPEHCHRRLVAEYLQQHWGEIEVVHL